MSIPSLESFLKSKKVFKLICGAGNRNYDEITKLCALYAAAGCRFFDLNASVEAVRAAKKGIKFAGKENECFICVSIGTKNDPHLSKYKINSEKCTSCGQCEKVCIQRAIKTVDNITSVDENNCIGCAKCADVCPNRAIEKYSKEISFSEILPPLIKEGIDCIEYHTITDNEDEVMQGWSIITKLFKGSLSVCLDRSKLGDERLIARLKSMKNFCDNMFMVQADGAPMSGGKDDYKTTLQAVAAADIVLKANITPYVIVSGGTNSKTMKLAKLCELDVSGFAAGSYARKIVKEFIDNKNFLHDEKIFASALLVAENFIHNS